MNAFEDRSYKRNLQYFVGERFLKRRFDTASKCHFLMTSPLGHLTAADDLTKFSKCLCCDVIVMTYYDLLSSARFHIRIYYYVATM